MELHERFMKLSTTGIDMLETLAGNREKESQVIHELVEAYNKKICNNVPNLKTLQTFRMILCYKYQTLIQSHNGDEPLKCKGRLYTDLKTLFIKENEYQKTEEFCVLYDIVVLQLVLSTKPLLRMAFKDFWDTEGLLSSAENVDLAMRVSECFADSYNLHTYLYKSPEDSAEFDEDLSHILMIIQCWMKQKEGLKWKRLALLLPKLITTFEPQKIISPLWQNLLGSLKILPPFGGKELSEITGLEEKLTVLCVMADVCFPSDVKQVKEFHYDQCVQDEFWCVLNQGLVCKNFQQRKQALYLLKRAIDFVEIHKLEIIKRLKLLKKSAMPFVCPKLDDQTSSLEEVKRNFFLILEVLEEKQKHLVLPALSHLPSLTNIQTDHESCCDCFDSIWLRCVYRKIVQHDNDSVKVFGLREILKSDPHIFFDDEFLLFFVDALNNTFLYEYDFKEEKPQIVKELEENFLRWERKKITLINSFVRILPSVSWGPVAIYWILQALLGVTEQCNIVTNVWGNGELHSVENLIQKSLMRHNVDLRTFSQILIIRTFIAYTSMPASPPNLECIFNILCSFPDNDNLGPGTDEWTQISKHVSKIIQPSDAVQYVTQSCKKMFTATQNIKLFALTIHLLAESELIFNANSCPAQKALQNLFQNLLEADVRPYADKNEILKIIEFLGHLMNQLTQELNSFVDIPETVKRIDTLIRPYIDSIFKVVCKSLDGKTISQYDEYVFVIRVLLMEGKTVLPTYRKEYDQIKNKCITILTNPDNYSRTQWSYAIKMLQSSYCISGIANLWKFDSTFMLSLLEYFRNEMANDRKQENVAQQDEKPKGQFASDCPEIIAQLLSKFITWSSVRRPISLEWLENLQMLVEISNEKVIDKVATILRALLIHDSTITRHSLEIIKSIVCISWRITFQLKATSETIQNVIALIRLITSEAFLKQEGCKDYAIECIDQLFQEGEKVPQFKQGLLHSGANIEMICSHKLFMSCLLHGTVPRRDQRIEIAAISHGKNLFNDIEPILFHATAIRKQSIHSVLGSRHVPEIQDSVLNNLLEILKQNKNKRYFDNSHLHRLKHRVMQTLLIQELVLNKPQKQRLYDALCDLLIAESNQPSVRLMHEWLLIRLCLKNADMREAMWKLFDTAAEIRPGSIVSIASVVFHVARLLSKETQREYIVKAISRLLPNCMSQQFKVRLYSQAILVEIYEMLPKDSTEAETYKEISKSVAESLTRGNSMKNSTRVLEDVFFTIFNPILDFNSQTIFYDLPRVTNVAIDEWISWKDGFSLQVFSEGGVGLKFQKSRGLLRDAEPYAKSLKPTGELEASADSTIDGGLSDIQMKINPWKTMVPFDDDLSEISKARLLRRKTQNEEVGIIVVASLIDRPPNLGGIARTCEIFGAQELVIGSLRYSEDREFQTLSVSAEKWITITEVKPHLLQNYLLEKQSEGWELVGAEQTANSINLVEMVFPKKTILLLGNEKDGIPANLIPLLDTCVEIPQTGVVRSLNVHVTGAICIWQYAKQHVLT